MCVKGRLVDERTAPPGPAETPRRSPLGERAIVLGVLGRLPRFGCMASKQSSTYAEASIRVLKRLEPVKQRPSIYTR